MSVFVLEVSSIKEAKDRLAAAKKLFKGIPRVEITVEARGFWVQEGFENDYPFGTFTMLGMWEHAFFKIGSLYVLDDKYSVPKTYLRVTDKVEQYLLESGYKKSDILSNPPRLRIRVEQAY